MKKYLCTACGYVYDPEKGDPENGVPAGTSFENLPDDWVCPLCGLGKEVFELINEQCEIGNYLQTAQTAYYAFL